MKKLIVERNRYFDSVFLMRISAELENLEGIAQAVVAMATPINVENLIKSGFDVSGETGGVQPADLLIAVDSSSEAAFAAADTRLKELLRGGGSEDQAATSRPSSVDEALNAAPDINLALISVPGVHAAREARMALQRGLHVMLFSDNVSVEDEIALKDDAIQRGLLMMGPDCGTAILHGAALGFANVCRRGRIGVVGASGTGIQEISSLVHRWGGGISQAIGTGGRDLSEAVAARMTLFGIDSLSRDPATEVIVVVSKTPSPAVATIVTDALHDAGKSGVIHFIGGEDATLSPEVETTATLAGAARAALRRAGGSMQETEPSKVRPDAGLDAGRAVGFFCGGTLCQETWNILRRSGLDVRSNVAGDPAYKVRPTETVHGHVMWDLGDDDFTVGKPHPMIEPSLRDARVAEAVGDPTVSLILADCVIGYGAHESPAGSLAEAASQALKQARSDGRSLAIISSVTGTDQDPQNATRQRRLLEEAGVVVAPSNAAAARTAAQWMKEVTT